MQCMLYVLQCMYGYHFILVLTLRFHVCTYVGNCQNLQDLNVSECNAVMVRPSCALFYVYIRTFCACAPVSLSHFSAECSCLSPVPCVCRTTP